MYRANDYSKIIGMEGFSETLLKNHFTLYRLKSKKAFRISP